MIKNNVITVLAENLARKKAWPQVILSTASYQYHADDINMNLIKSTWQKGECHVI